MMCFFIFTAETECINCEENSCDNSTGICEKCLKGFYGGKCQKSCPNTCPSCQQTTGRCLACRDGWFGPHCFFKCVLCYSCDIHTGICTTCKPTKWGPHCQDDCERNCYICRIHNGQCLQCSRGFYGENCEKTCSNCLKGLCRSTTGVCHFGCREGFFGRYCEKPCPTNCKKCEQKNGVCVLEIIPVLKTQDRNIKSENQIKSKEEIVFGSKKPRKLTIISNPLSKIKSDTSNALSQRNDIKSFSKKLASDVHVLVEGGPDTTITGANAIPKPEQKPENVTVIPNATTEIPTKQPGTLSPAEASTPRVPDTQILMEGGSGTASKIEETVPKNEDKKAKLTIISNPLSKLTSNVSNTMSQMDTSRKLESAVHLLMEGELHTSNKTQLTNSKLKDKSEQNATMSNI